MSLVSSASDIVNMLLRFGRFSGYKLYFLKSECFPINNLALQIAETDLPFPLSRSGFKYLGINVNCLFSGPYDKNFTPLINYRKYNLQKWRVLTLSLAGKITCIKKNILQRFFYISLRVFQSSFQSHSSDSLINCCLHFCGVTNIVEFVIYSSRGIKQRGYGSAKPDVLLLGSKPTKNSLLDSKTRC